jgi:acetylornithine deacetylase/succinyl-diaminopimelate desuccinylase-like protein
LVLIIERYGETVATVTDPRAAAVLRAVAKFDAGTLLEDLSRRVAFRTDSQASNNCTVLRDYLSDEIAPTLTRLGFVCRIVPNPISSGPPFLLAERREANDLPTVLTYGHGDVVPGDDGHWSDGRSPWELTVDGDRWYGRGTADNKGQHSINFSSLEAVLEARAGKLGYNVKVLFEMGEEVNSPGLNEICALEKDSLAADLLLASDGPRVSAERPTVFLGSRGEVTFTLVADFGKGAHHSGNWGGVLRNPALVLSHAIATLLDRNGRICIDGLRPPPVSRAVRNALADIEFGCDNASPKIDHMWGEPGLSAVERVIAWNALEVLAFKAGNADSPMSAIPARAKAVCQLRFVVGTDYTNVFERLNTHFQQHGLTGIEVLVEPTAAATRLNPDDPWVQWVIESMRLTTGKKPALLPNLGGTVPNHAFANVLGLPTLWIPHSYPACAQHAPNEHALGSIAREAVGMMAGLWWDLGDAAKEIIAKRIAALHVL